jgi:hypothetical protein
MSPIVSWGVPKRPRTPLLTQGAHEYLLRDGWGAWLIRELYGSNHFHLAIPIQPLPIDYMSPQRQLGGAQGARSPGVFPEDVVDVFEGLFKHGGYLQEAALWTSASSLT